MSYNILSEMNTSNVAGVPVPLNTVVTDNLISYVESYNPNLGKQGDDYHQKFQQFLANVASREYEIINMNELAKNEYKAYDLDINDEYVSPLARSIVDYINKGIKFISDYVNNPDNIIISPGNNREYIKASKKITFKDFQPR